MVAGDGEVDVLGQPRGRWRRLVENLAIAPEMDSKSVLLDEFLDVGDVAVVAGESVELLDDQQPDVVLADEGERLREDLPPSFEPDCSRSNSRRTSMRPMRPYSRSFRSCLARNHPPPSSASPRPWRLDQTRRKLTAVPASRSFTIDPSGNLVEDIEQRAQTFVELGGLVFRNGAGPGYGPVCGRGPASTTRIGGRAAGRLRTRAAGSHPPSTRIQPEAG